MEPREAGDLVLKARVFARVVYGDTMDEGIHLQTYAEDTAREIAESGGTPEQIIAAYVRDSLRLNLATVEDIRAMFGNEVAKLAQG